MPSAGSLASLRRRLLNLLTVLSLVLCVAAGGCIYIPLPDSPPRRGGPNPNPHRLIGRRGSKKPIRPGAVTRDEIVERLGAPFWQDSGGQAFIYRFRMIAGLWIVFPGCVWRTDRLVAARFDFGPDAVLDGIRMEGGRPRPVNFLGPTLPLPPMLEELKWATAKRAATQQSETGTGAGERSGDGT